MKEISTRQGRRTGLTKRLRESLTAQVRRLLNESAESRYKISKATGIDQASLSRFVRGERSLSADNLGTLAQHLGITFSTARPARSEPRR